MEKRVKRLTKEETKEGMRCSIKDGSAIAVRDTLFYNYSTPFAIALGAGNEMIGLVTAIPQLASALVSPFVGNIIESSRCRKSLCVSMQLWSHLLWLPVALIPLLFMMNGLWMFIFFITAAQIFRSVGSICWSTWMADIIPEKVRGRFFGKRNRAASMTAFAALLFGGWLLANTQGLSGFTALFAIGVMFGLFSYATLKKTPDITTHDAHRRFHFKFSDIAKTFKGNANFKNYTAMAFLFNFAVYMASPFFIVYMLRVMNVGYEWYAITIAAEVIITILAQPYWGKLADRYGDRPIMAVCGLLATFYPFLWFFITEPWHILFASALSGFAWAGFDTASFNYLLDVTPDKHRSKFISNFRFIATLGIVAGPIAGGLLANYFQSTAFLWLAGLQIVFLISFLLRGSIIAYFIPKLAETRIRRHYQIRNIFWKVVALYPIRGAAHDFETAYHTLHDVKHKIAVEQKTLFKGLTR